jgi:hypothetical protein
MGETNRRSFDSLRFRAELQAQRVNSAVSHKQNGHDTSRCRIADSYLIACASGEEHVDDKDCDQNQSPKDDVKRLEAEEALFAMEVGGRDVSFGVVVSVVEFRHVSSKNSGLMLSEQGV